MVYDAHGQRVGAIAARCTHALHAAVSKNAKDGKHGKHAKHSAHGRPAFSGSYSDLSLDQFLLRGSIGSE